MYDAKLSRCPVCGENSANHRCLKTFDNQIHLSPVREIIMFALGYVGFQLIGLVMSLCTQIGFTSQHPGDKEGLNLFVKSGQYNLIVTCSSYLIIAVIIAIVLYKDWKQVGKSFLNIFVLLGIAAVVANLVGSFINNAIITGIFNAMGSKVPQGQGSNQTVINEMVKLNPVLVFFVICILGPFVEEIGYRVGLFNFASRFGKIPGYLITIVVFAAIHISWQVVFSNPTTPEEITKFQLELISIPSYVLGGLVLTLAYDFGGLGASLVGHSIINMISFTIIMIELNNGSSTASQFASIMLF